MGNPKPVLDHEPEAVAWARRKAGLSQTQLAQRMGVSLSLVNMIERGKRNATPEHLLKLAEALNCPVVVLERKRYPVPLATPAEDEDDAAAKPAA